MGPPAKKVCSNFLKDLFSSFLNSFKSTHIVKSFFWVEIFRQDVVLKLVNRKLRNREMEQKPI